MCHPLVRASLLSLSLGLSAALSPCTAVAQSDPYVGQLMVTAANFCPLGWFQADGQTLSIQSYQVLYALLGTMYGGDGITTFNLPDLRGRSPIHVGQGAGLSSVSQGQFGGQESVSLSLAHLPAHTHTVGVPATSNAATHSAPASNRVLAQAQNAGIYADAAGTNTSLSANATGVAGGSAPVSMRNPYVGMLWCIAFNGSFPSHN